MKGSCVGPNRVGVLASLLVVPPNLEPPAKPLRRRRDRSDARLVEPNTHHPAW